MRRFPNVLLAVAALLLLVVGTAFAVRNPAAQDHRSPVAASHAPAASHQSEAGSGQDAGKDDTDEDDAGGPPPADLVAKLLDRLSAAGVETDEATLRGLIESNGVGGAVRLLAWADASGTSVADLQQMRSDGMGWGQIARQLNDADDTLHLSPGIGWVMSAGHAQGASAGKANGRASAPGQNKH